MIDNQHVEIQLQTVLPVYCLYSCKNMQAVDVLTHTMQ